ncbi:PPR4 [Symbiodinium sp. CCMP2592]|nr:PPR4 [Symbiodinium sp. CCMP2592]
MPVPMPERKPCRCLCLPGILLCLYLVRLQPRRSFGLAQDPSRLRLLREKAGINLRTRISNPNMTYSKESKSLLSRIAEARDRGDWQSVLGLFRKYGGKELPVFHAVLHTAFNCGQYKEGAKIYTRLQNLNITQDGAAYATALKLFAKLGDTARVRDIWKEARSNCLLDEPLAAARIDAAAAEGDIQVAAEILDEMNRTGVRINIAHVTSAIRACWEAAGSSHNAAEFLLNMSLELGLQPNIATFTCLMGAYSGARLEQVLDAYGLMQSMKVEANKPFTEVYLTTVLNVKRGEGRLIRSVQDTLALLRDCPPARLEAARAAVADFRAANIDIASLGRRFVRALKLLEQDAK